MTERREPFVLMIGIQEEYAAGQVGEELTRRGVRWIPFNTADFPVSASLDAELLPESSRWHGGIQHRGRDVPLEQVTAVYYGRPTEFIMPIGMSGPELRFSRAQARTGLGGVLSSLPVRWLSHPAALADAAYKPWQLSRLKEAGLTIPPTLITNDSGAVRRFAKIHGELIVKPLAESIVYESGGEALVYTDVVDLDDLDDVERTAHLFQQRQPKRFEVRLTAVGDELFSVAIHANSEKARLDWRSDYPSLWYEVVDVPESVRAGIGRYLRLSGLMFSVFDFVVLPDGQWVVLEANGIGAWGWLAEEFDLPIASAIADALTKE